MKSVIDMIRRCAQHQPNATSYVDTPPEVMGEAPPPPAGEDIAPEEMGYPDAASINTRTDADAQIDGSWA